MATERSGPRNTGETSPERDGERTAPEREYEGYVAEERAGSEAPDVVLDVPVLNVEELNLEVDDLRAHVSARAEIANLVRVNIGVDAYLGKVKLEIKGVEAQVLLKVKLDRILDTLDRALDAINRNPQILDRTLEGAGRALEGAGEVVQDAGETVGGVAEGVGDTVGDTAGQVTREAQDTAGRAAGAAGDVPDETAGEASSLADLGIEEEYVDEQGRIIGRARDEAGNVVEEVLDEGGNVLEHDAEREAEEGDDGGDAAEAEATDAARRKAQDLGVDLSTVEGTGAGGRILVKDVEKAARG
jgi:hypothetical protein